jgi:hypothetical protein
LYSSPSIIRMTKSKIRCTGHVVWMGAKKNAYNILVGTPQGKRLLEKPKRRLKYDIKF